MILKLFVRMASAVLLTIGPMASDAPAQEPSAAAIASAKELIIMKGGSSMFDPIVPGVIESAKNALLPTNPNLSRELNEVAAMLRKEYEPKRAEILNDVARTYAKRFTEQELRDLIVFYRTPLGKKVLTEEPRAVEEGLKRTQQWANAFSEEIFSRFRNEMKKKGHNL